MLGLPACVGSVAGTLLVTLEAVASGGTGAHLAHVPREARLAGAGSADVVALGAVLTAAGLSTAHAVGPHGTLLLTPGPTHT